MTLFCQSALQQMEKHGIDVGDIQVAIDEWLESGRVGPLPLPGYIRIDQADIDAALDSAEDESAEGEKRHWQRPGHIWRVDILYPHATNLPPDLTDHELDSVLRSPSSYFDPVEDEWDIEGLREWFAEQCHQGQERWVDYFHGGTDPEGGDGWFTICEGWEGIHGLQVAICRKVFGDEVANRVVEIIRHFRNEPNILRSGLNAEGKEHYVGDRNGGNPVMRWPNLASLVPTYRDIDEVLGEWGHSDEYSTCECGRVIRTSANCMSWEPNYIVSDGGIYCSECANSDDSVLTDWIAQRDHAGHDSDIYDEPAVSPSSHGFLRLDEITSEVGPESPIRRKDTSRYGCPFIYREVFTIPHYRVDSTEEGRSGAVRAATRLGWQALWGRDGSETILYVRPDPDQWDFSSCSATVDVPERDWEILIYAVSVWLCGKNDDFHSAQFDYLKSFLRAEREGV